MAQTAQSLQDVMITLRGAEEFLDRLAVEYEGIPADMRKHFVTIGMGTKRLQVAVKGLADVVLQLQARIEAVEQRDLGVSGDDEI